MSAVREAICKFLQADATGVMSVATDVFPKGVPEGAVHPFVVVKAHQPAKGEYAFQALSHEHSIYIVTGVDEGTSPARAANLKSLIRERLDEGEIEVEGYDTLLVSWMRDIEFEETAEDGTKYQHEGGLYEVWAEPL